MADKKRDEEQKKAEQQKNKAAGGRTAWEPESGTELEDSFVRERVLNRMESRRRRMRWAGLLVASAVVFGAVSCMVFVLLKPHAEQWFAKKEPETPIYVPRDEASETTEASTETEAPETISSEEDLKDAVESAVESYQWSVSDYQSLYRALNNVSGEANQGIVTVTTRTQTADADWFDNPIETEGKKSGLVWNITDSEVLILTAYRAQENETTVEVTFSGGERTAAVMKAADAHTGIAIVSVPLSNLAETVRGRLRAVPLGNSIDARAGQPVIVVGSPKDYVGSVAYGMLTYIRSGVPKEDMEVRLLCTDVSTGDGASGFVLNMDGAVIGMITVRDNRNQYLCCRNLRTKGCDRAPFQWRRHGLCGDYRSGCDTRYQRAAQNPQGRICFRCDPGGSCLQQRDPERRCNYGGGRRGGPDRENVPGLSGDQKPRTGCDH